MGVEIVQSVGNLFTYVFQMVYEIIDSAGLVPFYLTMASVLLVCVYLLSGFLHPASSESSRNHRKS